jgi:hypothetical protein
MIAKVNVNLVLKTNMSVVVQLWDVDVLIDDLIESQEVSKSGYVEFIFSTNRSGESNPELQIRIQSLDGYELYRTDVNNSIADLSIDEVTGFQEVSAIDFGLIEI